MFGSGPVAALSLLVGGPVGIPLDPRPADVDQGEVGAERVPADDPALIAEVNPDSVQIAGEPGKRPRALAARPAAAALLPPMDPVAVACLPRHRQPVVPQPRAAWPSATGRPSPVASVHSTQPSVIGTAAPATQESLHAGGVARRLGQVPVGGLRAGGGRRAQTQ